MVTGLPTSLLVNGREEPIRYEYTAVLDAMAALNDPDLKDNEKIYAFLFIIFENCDNFDKEDFSPAFQAATDFINNGASDDAKSNVRVVDFEQDYNVLIPAINRVAGKEIRACSDIHWWTFLGWFMEIGECTYSTVLSIRNKRRKGKKLEEWEREFYASNKKLVDLQPRLSEEEIEIKKRLNRLLD